MIKMHIFTAFVPLKVFLIQNIQYFLSFNVYLYVKILKSITLVICDTGREKII